MYLKQLDILGFKSFADKTRLTFEPGMIAIVGPNGCGKSNVSDAIRWVLGEQRPTALRCSKLSDVVFNAVDGEGLFDISREDTILGFINLAASLLVFGALSLKERLFAVRA